jgi:hypothetical protein
MQFFISKIVYCNLYNGGPLNNNFDFATKDYDSTIKYIPV